ncbi:ribosome biogenesis protein NOP53-like [Fagus crenata]
MGKRAKTSRKGKKAWRANISSKDIEDFYEKSTKDALSGGSLSSAPSDSLFFVDKSTDLSVKRKIEKHREKVLRCDSVLQKNPFVQLVPSSTRKKSKRKLKEVPKANDVTQVGSKDESATASAMVGLWDEKGEDNSKPKKKLKHSAIPAVEVEPPGCSFNPSVESHQDVLAHAVAEEMQKVYQNELGPKPVPLTVPGEAIDEEDMYFIEADGGSDDDNETNLENENEGIVQEKSSSKTKRVTRVELNKRARRKEHLKKEAARKMEEVSKEIDSFEPAPVQVLLSEELTGSLRKLKACCTLAKDRYKSLEKRGLIIPTVKSRRQQCPVVGEGDHCSFLKTVIFKLK